MVAEWQHHGEDWDCDQEADQPKDIQEWRKKVFSKPYIYIERERESVCVC